MTKSWTDRVLEIVLGLLVTISLGLAGWALTQVVSLRSEVAGMHGTMANRLSAADGLGIWQEIARIREQLAKLPAESPPKWFVDRFDRFEESVNRRLTDMDRKWEEHLRASARDAHKPPA